jgi:cyclophilin family peptidyl-prolyl cis-trans isomerase
MIRKNIALLMILSVAAMLLACGKQKRQEQTSQAVDSTQQISSEEKQPEYALTSAGNPIVVLNTTKGDIELEVFEKEAPNSAGNFIKLVKGNYYDGLIFYHVVPDVVIESGDMTGTGIGGPGYDLEPEKTPYNNQAGFVGMVPLQNGKSNGSRFYILAKDNPKMDEVSSCFAKVISGMENVVNISKTPAKKEKPIMVVKILTATLKMAESSGGVNEKKSTESSTTK